MGSFWQPIFGEVLVLILVLNLLICSNHHVYRQLCFVVFVSHLHSSQVVVFRDDLGIFWVFRNQMFFTINFADLHFEMESHSRLFVCIWYIWIFLVTELIIISIWHLSTFTGFIFNISINTLDAYELPAPVSSNVRHLIPFIFTTTTG